MKTIVNDFLKNNKDTKIHYVRDIYGYKCGVVVRLGRGKDAQIGWSMVNSSEDMSFRAVKPHQTPIWQWMIKEKIPMDIIVSHTFFNRLIENGCFIGVPKFDRETGLTLAINRALSYPTEKVSDSVLKVPKSTPYRTELLSVIADLANFEN